MFRKISTHELEEPTDELAVGEQYSCVVSVCSILFIRNLIKPFM
jgi:hypothetical protein